jgi:hypothetical protein
VNLTELKKLIKKHPTVSAMAAGGVLGAISEGSNVYFSLDPADVGQEEYEHRVKKNLVRGALVGGAGALTASHVIDLINKSASSPSSETAMHYKIASIDLPNIKTSPGIGTIASQALDKFKGSPFLQTVLGSGLLAGAAGGAYTAMAPKDADEDRGSRRRRIIRNALVMGALTSGGVALAGKSVGQLATALPSNDHGDPLTRTAWGAARVAPGLGVLAYRGHQINKHEEGAAKSLVQDLLEREQKLLGANETAMKVKFPAFVSPQGEIFKHMNARTGLTYATTPGTPGGTVSFGKGTLSPREALNELMRRPDSLGGHVGANGSVSGRSVMQKLMAADQLADGGALKGFNPITKAHLVDSGFNPAFLTQLGSKDPSIGAELRGAAELFAGRMRRPWSGRLGGVAGLGIAAGGLALPELIQGAAGGTTKALQFANDKIESIGDNTQA